MGGQRWVIAGTAQALQSHGLIQSKACTPLPPKRPVAEKTLTPRIYLSPANENSVAPEETPVEAAANGSPAAPGGAAGANADPAAPAADAAAVAAAGGGDGGAGGKKKKKKKKAADKNKPAVEAGNAALPGGDQVCVCVCVILYVIACVLSAC